MAKRKLKRVGSKKNVPLIELRNEKGEPLTASRVKKQVKILKKQLQELSKEHNYYMERAFFRAVQAWVLECSNHVHVDTGMSKGSLVPLAKEVELEGDVMAQITSQKKVGSKKGYYLISGTYVEEGVRNEETGIRLGKNAYHLSFGARKGRQHTFRFDINVFQWEINDSIWLALANADVAFENTLEKELREIPDLLGVIADDFIPF